MGIIDIDLTIALIVKCNRVTCSFELLLLGILLLVKRSGSDCKDFKLDM
jgi:hypothetical protein